MKRFALIAAIAMLIVCCFVVSVNAEECAHVDNWEVKLSADGVLGGWEAVNICPGCKTVLKDEFYEPLVECWGYSYFEGSFTQGFAVNTDAVAKYEEYAKKSFEYGVVAGIVDVVGTSPVNADGTTSNEKAIAYDLSQNNTEHFDIKIANIPAENFDKKIIACAYIIDGGVVLYGDGEAVGSRVAGVTYDEVVGLIDEGSVPAGLEEYRKLTAEEMDILFAQYWQSNNSTQYNVRRTVDNVPQKFASTRMFTRDELPSGSYVVVSDGWSVRPEIWKTDANGDVLRNTDKERPSAQSKGTYTIETLWRDTADENSDYVYMAFNVSDGQGGYVDQMTPDGIAEVLQIYVPYETKVAKNEVAAEENISVEGMQLLEWTETSLISGKFWNNSKATSNGMSTGNTYYTTCLFTKETLPVGSVIEINEGWICRFEYWKNSAGTSPRGPMMDSYRIVVTEEFWSGISDRAFNISTIEKDNLGSSMRDEVASAVRIYLPVE